VQAQVPKHYVEALTGIKVRRWPPALVHAQGGAVNACLFCSPNLLNPGKTAQRRKPHRCKHNAQVKLPKVSGTLFKEQLAQLTYVPLDKARCAWPLCRLLRALHEAWLCAVSRLQACHAAV
jgi:hypothetical protein